MLTTILCNMRSAHVASNVRSTRKVRKQRETNGTKLAKNRRKNEIMTSRQHGSNHTPMDRLPLKADDTAQFPMVSLVPRPFPGTSLRTVHSASMARQPVGFCQTAVLREPLTIFRTRLRSTLRLLEFWLSVRLNVNLHDVLNLSSISIDVLDLLSISFDVLGLSFPSPLAQVPPCDPKRHPRPTSSDMASFSLQASVHFHLSQEFRPHASGIFDSQHFHDGHLTTYHLLHAQDLSMEMSHPPHSSPRRDRFRRCGLHTYTWPSITHEDEVDRQVDAHPAQSHSETTSTIDCSALLYTTKHLGLPFKIRTRRSRACIFLLLGCCTRLASSFTADCNSHMSSLRELARIVHDR